MMRADVVIIGGGVVGSAIAFHLANAGQRSVIVMERDPSYERASSALSASSIRQQFTTPLCMEMSRYSFEFYKAISDILAVDGERPDIGLIERGYLYLAQEGREMALEAALKIQLANKVPVARLDRAALKNRFGWLNPDDLGLGAFGLSGEGWFDGYSVMQAFRKKARNLGVKYLADEATGFRFSGDRIAAVLSTKSGDVEGGVFINAAGPHAARIAEWASFTLPVAPQKRTIFAFSCPDVVENMPLVVDHSGLYVRPEGAGFIAGGPVWSPDAEPDDLQPDYLQFDEFIWPTLAHRIPVFERIKMTRAWAGHYEMNLVDHNALIGWAPGIGNLMIAAGFSGHGMQHAPATGRAVSELILKGRFETMDLSLLSVQRLRDGRKVEELNII